MEGSGKYVAFSHATTKKEAKEASGWMIKKKNLTKGSAKENES